MNLSASLTQFRESLNIPLTSLPEVKTWQLYIENIANLKEIRPLRKEDRLFERAQRVQDLFNHPKNSQGRMNVFAIQSLREEMKGILKEKVRNLKSMTSCGLILSKIKPYQKEAFLTAISLKFQECKLMGSVEEKAFSAALGHALSRSMMDPDKISNCEELKSYTCPISSRVILSDATYLKSRKLEGKPPFERYQEDAITKWVKARHKDPMQGTEVRDQEICKDAHAEREVEAVLCDYLYPEVKEISAAPSLGSFNPSENVFFSAFISYPIIKSLLDTDVVDVKEASAWITLAIDLFTPFLEEMDPKDLFAFINGIQESEEERMHSEGFLTPKDNFSQAFSPQWLERRSSPQVELFKANPLDGKMHFMKEFLKNEIVKSPSSEPLVEELRHKLQDKMDKYMPFFQEIEALDLSKDQKKDFQSQAVKVILEVPTQIEAAESSKGKKRTRAEIQTLESLMESALEKSGGSSIKRAAYNSSREKKQIELLTQVFS